MNLIRYKTSLKTVYYVHLDTIDIDINLTQIITSACSVLNVLTVLAMFNWKALFYCSSNVRFVSGENKEISPLGKGSFFVNLTFFKL